MFTVLHLISQGRQLLCRKMLLWSTPFLFDQMIGPGQTFNTLRKYMFSFSSEANNLYSDRAVNLFDLIFTKRKSVCECVDCHAKIAFCGNIVFL